MSISSIKVVIANHKPLQEIVDGALSSAERCKSKNRDNNRCAHCRLKQQNTEKKNNQSTKKVNTKKEEK